VTDEQFRSLCNVYGFAPSRSLRELLDSAISQSVLAERDACAQLAEQTVCDTHLPTGVNIYGSRVAKAIRQRSNP
jgi:hypothetical protein